MDLQIKAHGAGQRIGPFDVDYTEGVKVGYKWFEAEKKEPLFPFGFGLSYTTYHYSGLKVDEKQRLVKFSVKNGARAPAPKPLRCMWRIPASAGEPFKRLVAWKRVQLAPGESKTVTLPLTPLYLSIFNEATNDWQLYLATTKSSLAHRRAKLD